MSPPKRFYNTYEPDCSYYIFELAYILAVTKCTVYRILKKCNIRPLNPLFPRDKRFSLVSLMKIVTTKSFKRYIKRLKSHQNCSVTDISARHYSKCYMNVPQSKLNLMFKTPNQLLKDGVIKMQPEDIEDAIFSGLLPVFTINNQTYVLPSFIESLEAEGELS